MPKKEDLIYFLSLELENVRCFGSPMQPLDLTDGKGNPARWTLLLGENGLGKTTLSECLLWMKFVPKADPKNLNNPEEGIAEGPMEPSLPEAANDLIESFIRIGCEKLDIKAKFSQGIPLGKTLSKNKKSLPIKTGINVFFNGWSRTNNPIAGGAGIHHPKGDIKKISTFGITPNGNPDCYDGTGTITVPNYIWEINWKIVGVSPRLPRSAWRQPMR